MQSSTFETQIAFSQAHIFPCRYRSLQNIPHWHKEHELVFVQTGSAAVMFGGSPFALAEGRAAFLHSEEVHSIRADAGAIILVAKIDADYVQKIVGKKKLAAPVLGQDYGLAALFAELFAELNRADAYSGFIADSLTARLTAQIFREEPTAEARTTHRESAERYKSLLDLIARNYADITFDAAAEYMHFSRPYFSKFFLHHAGMTFTQYLNMVRVSHAAEMIIAGNRSMTEISRRCGFNTIRNFNRVFKEIIGCAPNALAKNEGFLQNLREYGGMGMGRG